MKKITKRFTNNCDVVVSIYENGRVTIDMGIMLWDVNTSNLEAINNTEIVKWIESHRVKG